MFAGCLLSDREGARHLRENGSDNLHVVQIDVTDDWQVRGAVKYVKENTQGKGNVTNRIFLWYNSTSILRCVNLKSSLTVFSKCLEKDLTIHSGVIPIFLIYVILIYPPLEQALINQVWL